jgi:hypothetical protein
MQLDAVRDQALESDRILGVVLRLHLDMGLGGSGLDRLLIDLGQLVPCRGVDHHAKPRAALPECRIVVVLGDLVEAELLVVVGANPLGRIDDPALQRA